MRMTYMAAAFILLGFAAPTRAQTPCAIGQSVTWKLQRDGTTIAAIDALPCIQDQNWQIVATGDFNGDGKQDLVWRHARLGAVVIWLMDGSTILGARVVGTYPPEWQLVVADLDGDGRDNLIWRRTVRTDATLTLSTSAASGGTVVHGLLQLALAVPVNTPIHVSVDTTAVTVTAPPVILGGRNAVAFDLTVAPVPAAFFATVRVTYGVTTLTTTLELQP